MERSTKHKTSPTGAYAIRADCPGCVSCAFISTFTATAVDKELTCSTCAISGLAGRELPNPFIFRVLDKLKGLPVAGVPVTYSVISFIDANGNASPGSNGAGITRVFPAAGTDFYGFNRAYLTLGPQLGTYVVEARCESCQDGQAQIAYGKALNREIKIFAPKTTYADPDDTPIVQITLAQKPSDFTTADGENHVALQARILGEEDQSLIRWSVEDDLSDYMPSGVPQLDNTNGPSSGFTLSAPPVGGVLRAATGRPLPLRYKIHAGAEVPGKAVLTQHRTVGQDPIDKCRQEYIDWSKAGEDLTEPKYFSRYARNDFLIGVDGAHDPDYVRYIDCYAHIPPSREAEVETLRSNVSFQIDVISGFRSPRKNRLQSPSGVWNSVHQFGEAVDIVPVANTREELAARFKELWYKTSCPKALERSGAKVMTVCDIGQSTSTYKPTYNESNVFGLANCIHLGD